MAAGGVAVAPVNTDTTEHWKHGIDVAAAGLRAWLRVVCGMTETIDQLPEHAGTKACR
jgi:hypothetical protein